VISSTPPVPRVAPPQEIPALRRPVSVAGGGKLITIVPRPFLLTCDVYFEHPLSGRQFSKSK